MSDRDRDQIGDVLVRYCTAIDTKDWELFRTCFTPDCTALYDDRPFTGREALTEHMVKVHQHLDGTLHRISNTVLDLESGRATATTYVDAILVRRDHPEGPLHQVAGRYTDTFAQLPDGGWAIGHRQFSRVWTAGSAAITR